MTVDDNLATLPTGVGLQADPYSGDVYVSWTSIDVNRSIPIARISTPTGSSWWSRRTGGTTSARVTIADVNNADVLTGRRQPTNERDTEPGDHGQPGAAAERERPDRATRRSPAARSRSPGTTSADQASSWPTRSPPASDYSFGEQHRPARSIPVGTYAPTGRRSHPGLDLQHHRPEQPRRHGQHRRHQRREPGPDPDRPQRRHVHAVPEPDLDRRGARPTPAGISGANLGVDHYTNNNIATTRSGRRSTTTRPATSSTPPPPGRMRTRRRTSATIGPRAGFGCGGVRSLDAFLRQELAKGINGTWKLETIDIQHQRPVQPRVTSSTGR